MRRSTSSSKTRQASVDRPAAIRRAFGPAWSRHLVAAVSCVVLLCVWQLGAVLVDAQVILPGPGPVLGALVRIMSLRPFSMNIGMTVLRALESFLLIVAAGTLFGLCAGFIPWVKAALNPILTVLKATPVMSVILLAFIWFSSGAVPIFSAFLMGFPVMFIQVSQSVTQMDSSLEQMCSLYGFSPSLKLKHYVVPSLLPSVITGARLTLSMVWKVVVAAEVLTVPRYGIGSRLQLAQVNLETSDVLAWTLIAVLLTALGELFFDIVLVLCRRISVLHARKAVPTAGGR